MLIGELKAADGAGAVIVQPLADAGRAEAVLAGQLHDAAAALEVVQADLALLLHLLSPCCRLYAAQKQLSASHNDSTLPSQTEQLHHAAVVLEVFQAVLASVPLGAPPRSARSTQQLSGRLLNVSIGNLTQPQARVWPRME